MEDWRKEFLAVYGQRYRYINKRWWRLDLQDFWHQEGARDHLYTAVYATAKPPGVPMQTYEINRLIAELSRHLRANSLPGRASADVWPPADPGISDTRESVDPGISDTDPA